MTIIDTTADNSRQFMTTGEAIAYLRVNARTLYRFIQTGDLPAVRIGRQWRIRRNEFEDWLERGRFVAPVSEKQRGRWGDDK
jgi:excisionase family DNA binding protein